MNAAAQYVYSVVTASLFVSILLSIMHDKSAVSAGIRLVAGIFLIIVAIAPLVKLRLEGTVTFIEDIETDASQIVAQAQDSRNEAILDVIKRESEAYVLDKAAEFGAVLMVDVSFQIEPPYLPQQIVIAGSASPMAKRQISTVISEDLGIPEEAQIWTLT